MNESISRLGESRAFSTMTLSSDTGVGHGSACDSLGRRGHEMFVFEACLVWST